jgi:hypothetical protein
MAEENFETEENVDAEETFEAEENFGFEEEEFDFEDEFDRLREKTVRTSAVYDEMEYEEVEAEESSGGFISQFSPTQRLILALLLLLDIAAIVVGALVVFEII